MEQSYETIWADACRHLSKKLSKDVYSRWISVIRPLAIKGDDLTLSVANDFYVCWLEENYLPLIRAAVAVAAGQDLQIRLVVENGAASALSLSPSPAEPAPVPQRMSRVAISTKAERPLPLLNPKLTFASFVVGPSNNFAHAACLAVAQSPAKAYNPLLIYGGAGLGKTHLMQAIGHHVAQTSKNAQVCYTSAEAFLNEYIDCLQEQRIAAFRRKYRGMDLLLIDDIHFLASKKQIQEEFFHTFNALYHANKQIVFSSDRPPSEVEGLDTRLVSRFEWGVTTQIEAPDMETRVAILKKKCESLAGTIPDDVVFFIAENVRSNIRRLEGALQSVAAYASLNNKAVTRALAEMVLRDTLDKLAIAVPTFDTIQKAVAEHFDIRLADMTSKRRPQSVALPRQVAMYLCRKLTTHSLPCIGDAFGRNHATVIHACRTVDHRINHDPAFRQSVTAVKKQLGFD